MTYNLLEASVAEIALLTLLEVDVVGLDGHLQDRHHCPLSLLTLELVPLTETHKPRNKTRVNLVTRRVMV